LQYNKKGGFVPPLKGIEMKEIEINGKKRTLRGTYGSIAKLGMRYDFTEMTQWGDFETLLFTTDAVWYFLDCWPKPFFFKWRFRKNADVEDIRKAVLVVYEILYGYKVEGDKEQKNLKESRQKSG
jgi:hypothetical protein